MQLNPYQKSLLQLMVFLLVFAGAVTVIGINRPYWGDEAHFAETVRYFGNEISLNTLKSYNEMSTPLPFVLYALWGKILALKYKHYVFFQSSLLFSRLSPFIIYSFPYSKNLKSR